MPDTDPRSNMMIRSVPRSVRLQLGSQAKARGLTLAQYLARRETDVAVLLAALTELTDALESEMDRNTEIPYPNEDVILPLLKAADAAIAQAQGRA